MLIKKLFQSLLNDGPWAVYSIVPIHIYNNSLFFGLFLVYHIELYFSWISSYIKIFNKQFYPQRDFKFYLCARNNLRGADFL